MSCSGPYATSRSSPREPDSPPREQEVRFWNNKQEVKPPPLSPISCNNSHLRAPTTVRRSRAQAEEQHSAGLPLLKKLSISVAKISAKSKELDSAAPETPSSVDSHLSGSFVTVTLGKMAALKQSLQEGTERVPSPARDDALDAAVTAQENSGKVQKQVIEIERKEGKEGGFLGKVFSRKPSPARLTIPAEPAAKVLSRKTSPPSPAGLRTNGLPPKRALSPQPFRGKTIEVLSEGRSQSAFQPRGAGMSPREPSHERETVRKFATSPQRDSTSRHTKEWVNALKPPGLPAAHESRKDSDAKALRDRRSHAVAMMQSAHSHREGAVLLQSPTVSSSEDDDMWDGPAETDRLSSDSAETSENEHLKLDRSEVLRRSASEQSHPSRADIQSAEFARLVQRQKSFEESAQRPRPVERRAGAVVDGRTETLFTRESHSFSMAQWKKEMGPSMGAHTMGHSGSFGGGKAAAGLSADALRNRQGDSPNNPSFGFAFDNAQFSDRVLVLEMSADVRHEVDGNSIDVKQLPGHAPPVRKPIHINSAIVAVKSQYFYNLLGENQHQAAVMRIRPEDEAPVLDMLRFMYSAELRASAPEELAQVLIVSDRYAVSSCFKHTFRLLSAVTVDALSACLFLDLPRHLKDPGHIQNLVLMARSWLVVHFRDLEKTYRTPEFLNLSLMGVRTILESNVLQIPSEVTAFNALVNWSRHHFPDSESQRAKVVAKLAHLIRFPFMTTEALRQALDMPELNSDVGRGLIVEALFFKAEPFFKLSKLAETETAHSRYVPRSNDSRLGVHLAPMDESGRQASVFFELPRTQFQNLQPGGHITSKAFVLGGQTLSAVVAKKAGKNSLTEGVLSLCIHNGVAAKSKDLSWPLANGSIDVPVKPWDGDGPKKIVGEYEYFTRFHTMDPFQSVARGKLAFKSGKEEQGQSTVKFPEDKNTMIYLRADLVIKS